MLRSKKRKILAEERAAEQLAIQRAEKEALRRKLSRFVMIRAMGISILSACVLMLATKKLFDEIFVEDDWSDVDWGEEDDFGVDID